MQRVEEHIRSVNTRHPPEIQHASLSSDIVPTLVSKDDERDGRSNNNNDNDSSDDEDIYKENSPLLPDASSSINN